jgi:hypothetical protein
MTPEPVPTCQMASNEGCEARGGVAMLGFNIAILSTRVVRQEKEICWLSSSTVFIEVGCECIILMSVPSCKRSALYCIVF